MKKSENKLQGKFGQRKEAARNTMMSRHREQRQRRGPTPAEEAELRQIFRTRRRASLESMESFVDVPLQGDSGIGIATGKDDKSAPKLRGQEQERQQEVRSVHSSKPTTDKSRKNRHSRTSDLESGNRSNQDRPVVYAGVTHSDLDVQISRPPMMYQMNVVEWLWLQSTQKHRVMILMLAVLLFVILLEIVFGFYILFKDKDLGSPYICRTVGCKVLAKRILNTLNKSINPCDDFYSFVCGSSDINNAATRYEQEYWGYGTYGQKTRYDYHKSLTIGKMLKRTKRFPENQILPMYKSCLDVVSRENFGLQPFYKTLKLFRLYDVAKDKNHSAAEVIYAMAAMMSYNFKPSAIIKDVYKLNKSELLIGFIPSMGGSLGGIWMYGFKTYKDVVKTSFSILEELNVGADELDILSHDIACLELYLRDKFEVPNGQNLLDKLAGDPDIQGQICDLDGNSNPANFGKSPDGDFNYTLLMENIYDIVNPNVEDRHLPTLWKQKMEKLAIQDFLGKFEKVFNHSAPYRILRLLQFKLFYTMSSDLNELAINTTVTVKRHFFYGIPYCVQRLFNRMPFVAPDRFIKSITGSSVEKIEREFYILSERVITGYHKVIVRNQFKEFAKYLGRDLTDREIHLLRYILMTILTTEHVPPVLFQEKNFPRYAELYEGISMDKHNFVENMLALGFRMQEWRIVPKYSQIFYGIKTQLQRFIWMDKVESSYVETWHKHVVYIPFSSIAQPLFRESLIVSDFSGLGIIMAGCIERAHTSFLSSYQNLIEKSMKIKHEKVWNTSRHHNIFVILANKDNFNDLHHYLKEHVKLKEDGYTEDEMKFLAESLKNFSTDWTTQQFVSEKERWKIGQEVMGPYLYNYSYKDAGKIIATEQRRWHIMGLIVDEFLNQPKNWKHRKTVLEGLEEFNTMQLFYITRINRRCEKMVQGKKLWIDKYGPLPDSIRDIEGLTNDPGFARTFKCSVGTFMNPKDDKISFWDQDLNISNFNFNESKIMFFESA